MPYKFREIRQRLLKLGFSIDRQKGSHVVFVKKGTPSIPIPFHAGKDVSPGIERKILKLTGLSAEEFRNLK